MEVHSLQLIICVEQEQQETAGITQQVEFTGSYRQQLKQVDETITTLMQQLSQLQQSTSLLICYY